MTADARAGADLEIWQHRFAGVCDEMGGALQRGAYSPNIKERADFSCALFSPDGELVAQAEHIPVHLGSMAASVSAALDAFPDLAPGDQVVLNDPFRGGTHLNDVTFVAAVSSGDGTPLGYVANRAHHADVGGAVPGSLSADAIDAVAEGLTIPPVRAVRGEEWDTDLRAMLLANTRTPTERAGDLDAQFGANRIGSRRLAELADRHGSEVVVSASERLRDHGARRLGAALREAYGRVGGILEFEDNLEGPDGEFVPVHVAVALAPDRLVADFTGTGAARRGVPSAVEAVTRACLEFVVRCCVGGDVPRNGGASRLLNLVAPPGSVVAARPPVPVGAGNVEASQRIADVLLGALAPAFPDRVGAASQGTMNNVLVGGESADGPFVYYETIGGGQGGRPRAPGQSGIHTGMTNTANTPVEALEAAYPLRVLRYGLRRGSGGGGLHPGGDGIERDLVVLADCTVSLTTERRAVPPWGLDGGGPGAVGENWLVPAGDESRAERLPAKCTLRLRAGDVVRVLTPGGGGWGPRREM
ncbi:MAG: hydantoinase B/oxoprolinase family protein [Acidimicrobiia bacterium]